MGAAQDPQVMWNQWSKQRQKSNFCRCLSILLLFAISLIPAIFAATSDARTCWNFIVRIVGTLWAIDAWCCWDMLELCALFPPSDPVIQCFKHVQIMLFFHAFSDNLSTWKRNQPQYVLPHCHNYQDEQIEIWWWHWAPDDRWREPSRRHWCENTSHRCNRLDSGFRATHPTNTCSSPSGLLWCSACTWKFTSDLMHLLMTMRPSYGHFIFGTCLLSRFWLLWWPRTVYLLLLSSLCTCSASLQWNSLWKKRSIMDFRTHLALRASLWTRSGKTGT